MISPVADPALAIRAARVLAIRQAPYLATALLRMLLIETDQVSTMGVDKRWRVYVNPEFVAGRTVDELAYIWLHEAGHCLRAHPTRWETLAEPNSRHGLFNIAGDVLINGDLDDFISTRPADRTLIQHLPAVGARRDMSVEEIYRLLLEADEDRDPEDGEDQQDPGGPIADCGSGAGGEPRAWELPDGQDGSVDEGTAELIRDTVAQQIRAHVAIGNVPAGFARWAEETLDPVVDWHRELRSVLTKEVSQRAGRRDYSYARPGRRRLPGVVLPAMVTPPPPTVAVVIDTSGSMRDDDLARALAETAELVQRAGRSRGPLKVISCDSSASSATVVRSMEQVELVGGGGTDMRAGIESALKLAPKVDVIVVLTDGFTPWPQAPLSRPGVRLVAVLTRPEAVGRVPDWIRTIDASAAGASAA